MDARPWHPGRLGSPLMAVGLALLAGCDPPQGSEPAEVRTVSVTELASMQGEVVVLDVREFASFSEGHVPGAIWLDPDALRTTAEGVEGQVASRTTAETWLSDAGLAAYDPVVIAGDTNGTEPARVAWTLMHYGHEAPVSLLDGGMRAWASAGRDQTTEDFPRGTTGYLGTATREALRVDQAWVLAHLGDPDVAFFDVRSDEEFEQGHLPGARSVGWTHNLTPGGIFLPAEDVRALHGEPTQATLVVYCRTGSRAAVSWALLRAAGYDDVRLYDGSWAEWGADPDTPKEEGPARQ